jgi:hypothetical protein
MIIREKKAWGKIQAHSIPNLFKHSNKYLNVKYLPSDYYGADTNHPLKSEEDGYRPYIWEK